MWVLHDTAENAVSLSVDTMEGGGGGGGGDEGNDHFMAKGHIANHTYIA